MGFFTSEKFDNLEDLLTHEMRDIYDAENRLIDALPKMAETASSPALRRAFSDHLQETRGHLDRLEQAFSDLGQEPARETCNAMKGLIAEGEEALDAEANPELKDAALIAAAQRVEHYEMAGYGTLRNLAQRVGHGEIANLFEQTLDEEKAADQRLSHVAVEQVNPEALKS